MEALADSPDVFEEFFVSARIGLALADLNGSYVRVNRTYAELLGRLPEDLVGVRLADVLEDALALDLAELAGGRRDAVQSEQAYTHTDGTTAWVLHGVAAVAGPDGRPAWFAVSAQDITERRRAEEELRAATRRSPSRRSRPADRPGQPHAVRRAPARRAVPRRPHRRLDRRAVPRPRRLQGRQRPPRARGGRRGAARRRRAACRPACARPTPVARLGGDEFVVLVEGATPAGMSALVARLRDAVQAPLTVRGHTLDVGVSVGMALAAEGSADPASLVAEADKRMYAASAATR
jgi:PAS domain S-box-containing protein